MRNLNARQKKLLDNWIEQNRSSIPFAFNMEINEFPYDLYEKLQEINDHETIVQNINRYVSDKITEYMMRK